MAYYNKDNSPLRPAIDRGTELGNDYVLINGIQFDKEGNLWVLNSQARGVNMLQLSRNKEWNNYYHELLNDPSGVTLDPSVFCYNIATDELIKYNSFVNQDGLSYSPAFVNCVCEDREHHIWVGTNIGPFMIKSDEVGQEKVTFYQVKVPRNDGTNYADYLLNNVYINHIDIDGGNRKWFATNGAGAFLISADNITQIENFKEDNSYLLSNIVNSTAINQKTGKIYFLTGLPLLVLLTMLT